jgi:hypothetical protein
MWQRYRAPSDDRRSTTLRALTGDESVAAVDELVSLATRTAVAAATSPDAPLATLADLS